MPAEPNTTSKHDRPVWLYAAIAAVLLGIVAGVQCHHYQAWQRGEIPAAERLWTLAARGEADGVRSLIEASDRRMESAALTQTDLEMSLRFAVAYGHESVVAVLLERGVSPDPPGRAGATPLMSVGHRDESVAIARRLIAAGANVDARDDDGRTALIDAAAAGNVPLARLLIEAGAEPGAVDRRGQSALTEAEKNGDAELVQLITAAAAASP
jgi:ankyrin repeat protein